MGESKSCDIVMMADVCDLEDQRLLFPNRMDTGYGSRDLENKHVVVVAGHERTREVQKDNLIDQQYFDGKNNRPDGTVLSYEQANTLMITLENTKNVIENYIQTLELDEGRETPAPRRKSWWGRHCWPRKRRWLYRYITIVTVTLQFLNLLILSLLDAWPKPMKERPYVVASAVTMIFLQLINLFFLILASGRLVKQIYRNSVNSVFLAQTYGATILLFAGLYTVTYRLKKHSWKFVNEDLYTDPVQVFVLYAKFLFYSISTATLCGSDNVLPAEWFNCLFAGFQMLLSFCYFASILGSAMCHDNTRPPAVPNASAPFSISLQKHRDDSLRQDQNQHQHCQNQQHHCHQQQQHQQHQQERLNTRLGTSNQSAFMNRHPPHPHAHSTVNHLHSPSCCIGSLLSITNGPRSSPSQCLNLIGQHCEHHHSMNRGDANGDGNVASCSSHSYTGETNPIFLMDPPGSANLEDSAGSSPDKSSENSLDVDVLNAQHLQVEFKH